MAESKIISDLPTSVSVDWAKSQAEREDLKPLVPIQALPTIESYKVSQETAFDLLFGTNESHKSIATFTPPPGFYDQVRGPANLFSGGALVPSIGDPEKIYNQYEEFSGRAFPESAETDRTVINTLFLQLNEAGKNLTDLLNCCGQYKKG